MITTILLDLDDTLLGNNMNTFLPQYFGLLDNFTVRNFGLVDFVPEVIRASAVMSGNTDANLTNREVFWQALDRLVTLDLSEAEEQFDRFYRNEFHHLRQYTDAVPAAKELVETCFEKGHKVIIATNPMFPRRAVEARLEWAGVPPSEYPYDLVTTIENMHATKPHLEYYREILSIVDSVPEEALMVGDDWERDIEPAASLGLFTYWINLQETTLPETKVPTEDGSLDKLLSLIRSGWLDQLSAAS